MSMPSLSLEGRSAIVTGSRRGIGAAIAIAFAQAGADVAVSDWVVEGGELEAVARKIKKLGRQVLAIRTDVTKASDVDNLVKRATKEFGFVDILVNNAGGNKPSSHPKGQELEFHETPEADWFGDFNNNFRGTFLCSQAVMSGMIKRKKGSIVNMSSVAAEPRGSARAYHVAKAAINRLTQGMAHDYARYNIRVNAMEPAWTRTEMTRSHVWGDSVLLEQRKALIPLGRIAEPEDIASLALFLASDASSWITGQVILIDGGFLSPHSYEVPGMLAAVNKSKIPVHKHAFRE